MNDLSLDLVVQKFLMSLKLACFYHNDLLCFRDMLNCYASKKFGPFRNGFQKGDLTLMNIGKIVQEIFWNKSFSLS